MKFIPRLLIHTFLLFAAVCSRAETMDSVYTFLNENRIFEWWDDGLITGEEAEEILSKIEEDNFAEACHLAEALALENCAPRGKPAEKERTTLEKAGSIKGFFAYKVKADSAGKIRDTFLDLDMNFYRFHLHLGSRQQLSYRHRGAEAYFGQIASREFHSQIGTDTLWGTALSYTLGKLRFQGVLDSALNLQAGLGYQKKGLSVGGFAWFHPEHPEGDVIQGQASSVVLQLKIPEGEIASWWQPGQKAPLTRLRLQKNFGKKDSLQISWQTSAYIHGKEIPEQAYLSSTYAKNKFTGTQAVAVSFPTRLGGRSDPWITKITANARVLSPLGTDSLKSRLKVSAESGPEFFRVAASASCAEATDHCPQNDLSLKLSSQGFSDFALGASIRTRHTRHQGFDAPRTEGTITYQPSPQLVSGITLMIPQGYPQRQFQVRTENFLGTGRIQSGLVVTFRRKQGENLHPIHGNFQIKLLF
ncbi:MAG: hypothetical protein MJY87_05425 [Fibrobacter sp.]|nr:hypothetical protein [Fibrobacter sp.]